MAVDLPNLPTKKTSSPNKQTVNRNNPVLARVASGQSDAIDECLAKFGGLVWSLARRRCPDEQTTEDAVQDIFIQIWQAADRYDANLSSEATFIAMIARRRLIDMYRKRQPDQVVSIDSASLQSCQDSRQTAATHAELQDDARQAEQFLAELPEQQQHVIRLSVYDGLSHSRIAEATGLALGTVKTHLRRGLGELQRRLFAASARDGGTS